MLGFFLVTTLPVLNPLVLFLLLWAVLLPFRGSPGFSTLLVTAAALTGIWLLAETGSLLAPFVLAVALAYILDPLVDRLERYRISRSLAIALLIAVALAVLAAIVLVALPRALRHLEEIVSSAPVLFEVLGRWIEGAEGWLRTVNVPLLDGNALAERLQAVDSDEIVTFLQERRVALAEYLWSTILGLGRGIGSFMTLFGYVVLTPVLTFYLIRDFDLIKERLIRLIPVPHRDDTVLFFSECDRLVASYLRGQLLVAAIIGVLTGVGLGITRFPYASSIGLMVGILSVVPYLGLLLSLLPTIIIALVSGSAAISLLKVAVVFGTTQLLDGTVITPRVVGGSVGIHPVWVLLALSLGGYFFGVVGLLIGVPAAAVTKLLIGRALARYEASDFYRGPAGHPEPGPIE